MSKITESEIEQNSLRYEAKYGYDKIKAYITYYTKELEGVYSGWTRDFQAEGIALVMAYTPVEAGMILKEELGIEHQYWCGELSIIEVSVGEPSARLIESLEEFNKDRHVVKLKGGLGKVEDE